MDADGRQTGESPGTQERREQVSTAEKSPLLHSIADTGTQLGGTSRSRVYELIAADELEVVSIGRRTFVTGDSLAAYVDRLRGKAPPAGD